MGRVLLVLLLLAAVAVIGYGLTRLFHYAVKRSRQRELARHAPDLLRHEDLDPQVAEIIIGLRARNDEIRTILTRLEEDPVVFLPTEYHTPIHTWLTKSRKKEI